MTYNQAYSQLEALVIEIESDAIQLDTLADKVKQANALIQLCEAKLRTIEKEVNDAVNTKNKG
ncbi:MAG: exodeoxyribonuclease VII small subunit [Azospira oryzae]|nr:exodeoxyribonuclease VII small subunit [Cytophaga sp.]PZR41635.1 MAG: exodeoxyribonuclease VII small subunit [Azospira oryzae]